MNTFSTIYLNMDVFLLVTARISGFVLVSPILGRKGIPNTTKVGLSVLLSAIIMLGFNSIPDLSGIHELAYIVLILKETLIGIMVSFITVIFFSIFYSAGQLTDLHIGLNTGGMYDVAMQTQVPMTGNLFYTLGALVFLLSDGMSKLIFLLQSLYEHVPVTQGTISELIVEIFFSAFTFTYAYAVRLIMPLVVLIIVVQVLLGIIIKFVPQMNVFIIGMPVKIILSFMLLVFIIGPMFQMLGEFFDVMFESALLLIRGLADG